MKKSEALKTLGLSPGASDDDIKKAHRKLVVENHPDKFGQDATARAQAEEKTKRINEARDVLLNGTWDPESRTAGTPYGAPFQYNPYAAGNPFAAGQASGNPYAAGGQGSSAGGFPFEQFVWTTWDAAGNRTTYTASGAKRSTTSPGAGARGAWADPFSAFFDFGSFTPREPTLSERIAFAKGKLALDGKLVAVKLVILAVSLLLGASATGLYLYTILSIGQGIWKRLRFLSVVLLVPFAMLALIFTPAADARIGLIALIVFCCALCFDVQNIYRHAKTLLELKKQAAK